MITSGNQDTINISDQIGKYLEYLRVEKPEILGLAAAEGLFTFIKSGIVGTAVRSQAPLKIIIGIK